MLTAHRKQLLLERLRRDGRIVAKDLSAELDLSEDTIRRDLRELASEGLLQRVHGGALPASPTIANLAARRGMAADEKRRLGARAATLVARSQRIFIDGGTTNLELVRGLPLDLAATVITHSPAIAAALEPHHAIEVIVIGGKLFRHSMVTVGAAALEAISRLHIDLSFIGVTGLHPQEGGTTGDFEEAAIKRAVIARSAETVLLVTSEKIGAVSAYSVCALGELTAIIVPREAQSDGFANLDLELIRA
jgi:DeoR/GlpR family transcriptional regulator of sugar metabolism